MESRLSKAPAKSLTISGQHKPARVEKPKRKHRVKQGTPSKLSESQKRKLVRLYVFTTLSWKDISGLVLYFGCKDVKKRALQYVLQDLFSVQYNQLRPKGIAARRKRESEMQQCKQVKSHREQRRDANEGSWKWNAFALSQITDETADHDIGLDLDAAPTDACQPATMTDEGNIYLNDFDRYIHVHKIQEDCVDVPDSDTLLSVVPKEFTTSARLLSLPSSNLELGLPLHPELNETNVSHAHGCDPSTQISPFLLDSPWPSVHTGASPLGSECLYPQRSTSPLGGKTLHNITNDDLNASNAAFFTRFEQSNVSDVDKHASMPNPSSRLVLATEDPSRNATSSKILSQRVRMSELSALVDRLSSCSLGEKGFIKATLTRFSAATVSTMTNSIRSHFSTSSCQTPENSKSYMATASVPSEISSKAYRISRAVNSRIFSNGIFWKHMADGMQEQPSFRSIYREGLGDCVSMNNLSWNGPWHFPVAVTLDVLEGLAWDIIWRESGIPGWGDLFGNTSLHIAAACGAQYSQLQALIFHDVYVNALNSARQTFMHLLNPDALSPDDMFSLQAQLYHKGFDFFQRDVEGRLFLDVLKYRKMDPLVFARCWLQPLIRQKDSVTPYISYYKQVRKIFQESGGHSDQWKALGWAEPPWADHNASGFFGCFPHSNEFLKAPAIESQNLVDFESTSNRSSLGDLNLSPNDTPEHTNASEPTDHSPNGSHLSSVRHLLSIGVDISGHDERGVTPLMALICHVPYRHAIVQELLHSRVDANARKKGGETALHIAVKIGNIDATKALLGQGANVHVRTRRGEGLLKVAERAQRRAKNNVSHYAKITACMALVIDAGAIASPNIFDEWSLPYSIEPGFRGSTF
ncbi:MAG: hypothetical protein Q9180_004177 [Flavoplaca navasiana]